MNLLSRSEEIILATILKIGDNAYGVSIRNQIFKDTGDKWSFASIYQPLSRLERKKFVERIKGEPSSERGGKSKYFYVLTIEGKKALLEIKNSHDQIWKNMPLINIKEPAKNE
jgi:DNA-binding PadR family transcriptional regulator